MLVVVLVAAEVVIVVVAVVVFVVDIDAAIFLDTLLAAFLAAREAA